MSRRKLIISLLLFLIYEAGVWFGAGALAAPANFLLVVFVLTALGLTVLIVYLLISRLTTASKPAPPAPTAGAGQDQAPPVAPAPRTGADPELETVSVLLNEANNRLAQSPTLASRRLRTTVYNLPLFLLSGPEGAGKTTTFLKAGLEPELLAGQVFRDANVLPTRLANFWFTSDSLFVEPSGNLFSQDAGRWRALLDRLQGKSARGFLKKLFPGKTPPQLRGFVLFVDIGPFLGVPDPSRIGNLGRRIQERLRIAGESFGTNFPVYVVFTKSDTAPYFSDFFGHLTETEDQQILGCTVPAVAPSQRPAGEVFAESETARLSEAFNSLYYSLAEKRLTMLARETNAAKKPAIYEFPRELKRLRDTLVQFLVDVFRPNPLQPGPILRGFYFTGTRTVALSALAAVASPDQPQRPALGEATRLFDVAEYQKRIGLAAETPSSPVETTVSRWCFVSELFHRVILADPLGRRVAYTSPRHDMSRRVLFGGLAAVCAIFAVLFIRSWWGNAELLSQVEQAAQTPYAFTPNLRATPSLDALRGMEALRQQLATLLDYERNGAPWRLRWGLYSGTRVLPSVYDLYFQRFRQSFFQDAHDSIASTLATLPPMPDPNRGYNAIYDRVKAYRMITQCKCTPDKAFLAPVLSEVWLSGRAIDPERQALALRQIDFYAEELRHRNPYNFKERPELTDRGRQYLSAFGGVDRLYRGIVEDTNRQRSAARLADLAPNWKQALSGPGEVQGAFTRDGWNYAEKAISNPDQASLGEPCVLGGAGALKQFAQGAQIQAQLQNRYIADYIRKWRDFTATTSVEPFRSIPDAAKKLEILAGNRSPLLAALFLIADNTSFPAATPGAGSAVQAAAGSGLLNKLLPAKVQKVAAVAQNALPAGEPQASPADIARIFQPASQVVSVTNRDRLIDDPNRNYMNALAAMQTAMKALVDDRPNNPNLALHQSAKQAADAGIDQVRQIAAKFNINGSEGFDQDVKRLLESPFHESMKFIITDVGKAGREKANGAARQFCARLAPVERKFPFNAQSDVDASADEVAAIFAPGTGAFSTLQQQLSKAMVKQGRIWAPASDADVQLTPEYLRFVNRLQQIQDALFADSSGQMHMRYSLKPLPNPSVQSMTLEIDGDRLVSAGAQTQAKQFTWPGPPGAQQTKIRVQAGASVPFASYEGLWSVFRMVGDADPRPPGSRIIELSKVRQGRSTPDSVLDSNNKPIVVRLEIGDLPGGIDVFDRNFFRIACVARAAQ
jgi:type VI secretion system protein ImpL